MTLQQRWRKLAEDMSRDSGLANSHAAGLEMSELVAESPAEKQPTILWSNPLGFYVVNNLISQDEFLYGFAAVHADLSRITEQTKLIALGSSDASANVELQALMAQQTLCLHKLSVLVEEFKSG